MSWTRRGTKQREERSRRQGTICACAPIGHCKRGVAGIPISDAERADRLVSSRRDAGLSRSRGQRDLRVGKSNRLTESAHRIRRREGRGTRKLLSTAAGEWAVLLRGPLRARCGACDDRRVESATHSGAAAVRGRDAGRSRAFACLCRTAEARAPLLIRSAPRSFCVRSASDAVSFSLQRAVRTARARWRPERQTAAGSAQAGAPSERRTQ